MSITTTAHSSYTKITIKDLKYTETKRKGFFQRDHKHYMKLTIDDQVRRTSVSARTNAVAWNESFDFYVQDSSKLIIEIFARRTSQSDERVGGIEDRVDNLLLQHDVSRELDGGTSGKSSAICIFTITKSLDPLPALEVQRAKEDTTQLNDVPFQHLLKNADIFMNLVAGISEVDPYAKAAWSTLLIASKIVQDQVNRDENIRKLLISLDDLLVFLLEAEALKSPQFVLTQVSRQQVKILEKVSMQINECAYFISEYAKDVKPGLRTLKHIFSNIDSQIKEFQDTFDKFKSAFQDYGNLSIQLTVCQIWFVADDLKNMASEIDLNEMLYADGASCIQEKGCLPGTRQGIIDEIMDWVNQPIDDQSPRMLWLSGVAGSGKSAIAHSIAHRLESLNRLGSSFCFDAAKQATRGPMHLFSTIARDLAGFDPLWKQALWNVLQQHQSKRKSYSLLDQFENFLVQPAQNLTILGPIVLVIDALDECGDPASREVLLEILDAKLHALPRNFRIIVTSRPERDIVDKLQDKPYIVSKTMSSISLSNSNNDIVAFIHKKLDEGTKKQLVKYDSDWCGTLVDKAEGLFQWASTACLFIRQNGTVPREQFQILCQDSDIGSQLDSLYHRILNQIFPNGNDVVKRRFRTVMGVVLNVKHPLPISALSLLCPGETSEGVKSILVPMGALLDGVASDSIPVHTLHTSFRDFLMKENYSENFFIGSGEVHQNIAISCLEVMGVRLKFNICQLETSCIFNDDIPDLEEKVKRYIPEYLEYASSYWADHLKMSPHNRKLEVQCKDWMRNQFLYWLEVLSLTQMVYTGVKSLENLAEWIVN